jgi:large subunit ribosomal protein L32
MALPKKKTSKSKRDKRRSHDRLTPLSLSLCPQCHEPKLPHRVCPHCGQYKGKEIVEVEGT